MAQRVLLAHERQLGLAAARSPGEEGDIFRIAICIRALKAYGPPGRAAEMDAWVRKARQWLQAIKPSTPRLIAQA